MKRILIGLLLVSASTVSAKEMCQALFNESQTYQSYISGRQITTGEVVVNNKKLPVLMMNRRNFSNAADLYENSMGIVVTYQKGYNNDHGLLRLGKHFIDRDLPGYRERGEINDTGISWVDVGGYVNHVDGRESYDRVEVLFSLSASEKTVATAYQKMRRAALVRPDFTFGGGENPRGVNNILEHGGEICFSFSTGSSVGEQVYGLKQKLTAMKINPKTFFADKEIKEFFEGLTEELALAEISENTLNPEFVSQYIQPKSLAKLKLSEEKLNWLVSYYVSEKYEKLLTELQIEDSSSYSNVSSPRASAIVIYDSMSTDQQFLSPKYKTEGVFSTWTNTQLTPLQDSKKAGK